METFTAVLVVVASVLLAVPVWSWYRRVNDEKYRVIRRLDGRWVTLGLSWGRDLILEFTGTLRVGPSRKDVILESRKDRTVPVGQIRWIKDARTGAEIAGPW